MILSINTSTVQFSIAILEEDGAVVAESIIFSGSKSFRSFMPALKNLFSFSRVGTGEIKALAVTTGPGSFTGLRVGLSAAKGMCRSLGIPIVGVSSLEAMAGQLPFSMYPACPIIDSRKGEVFAALFSWSTDQKRMLRLTEDKCLKLEDLSSLVNGKTVFLGNDLRRQSAVIMNLCGERALLAPPSMWTLKASAVGMLGIRKAHEQGYDNLHELVPSYMRPPDIRPNPYPLSGEKSMLDSGTRKGKKIDK